MVFHRLAYPYQKLLPKSAGGLSWPEMAFWNMRRSHWSQVSGSGVKFTSNPMFECASIMVFVQKRRFSIFSHGLLIIERSQNWPNLRTPISKFQDIYFIDRYCYSYQSLKVLRRSFGRCRYDEHSNFFFWGEVTWRDLVTWHWAIWVWNLHNMCAQDVYRHRCSHTTDIQQNYKGCPNLLPSRPGAGYSLVWPVYSKTKRGKS